LTFVIMDSGLAADAAPRNDEKERERALARIVRGGGDLRFLISIAAFWLGRFWCETSAVSRADAIQCDSSLATRLPASLVVSQRH
jgi:hypothetical protein